MQVALACHLRVASPRASLGLPEVLIGLLPGAGGTQRLPRLVKAEMALGMITTGKMVNTYLTYINYKSMIPTFSDNVPRHSSIASGKDEIVLDGFRKK